MSKWSLNSKVYAIIAIFVMACTAISFVGITKLAELNATIDSIVDKDAKRIEYVSELNVVYLSQVISEKDMIIEQDKSKMESYSKKLDEDYKNIHKILTEWSGNASEKGRVKIGEFKEAYALWWNIHQQVRTMTFNRDDKGAFELSTSKGLEVRTKIEEILDSVVAINKSNMNKSSLHADVQYSNAKMLLIAISIGATLFGLIITFFVMKSLSKAIDQIIFNLTDNSNQVTSAAQQIASSSEELSQAATEQASALEETASSIEELNSMVQKNAENAKKTSEIAGGSKQNANKGKDVVNEMIMAIDDINVSNANIMDSINESNKKISEIVDVIAEIGNKTKVINDIVFQTKLLSFNASVEAARAGEHGKGFAVVAEEVGNLAAMSGNAAKEITALLDGSIQRVQSIVNETKEKVEHLVVDGKNKVDKGTRIARECGSVLDEIVDNITNVNEMSDEISVACQEQAQGVNEITKAMGQLDQVTQTNTATSQEAAASAEELSAQAQALRGVITLLVDTIKGSNKTNTQVEYKAPTIVKNHSLKNNVIPLKVKSAPSISNHKPLAKAVGFDSRPAENDPRFEEI